MSAEPEFIRLQRAFTRHLRDPDNVAAPGAHEERRMAIYRHAIYANVAGFMGDNYPRVRAVFDEEHWQAMLREYIVRHVSWSSAFVELPQEFLAYLEHERDDPADPPFLLELAHFDWLETLVGADTRSIDSAVFDRDGDLLSGVPYPNPIMRRIDYAYPVHAIDENYLPQEPPATPTRIAAFRDPDNHYGFLDLNDASARLLDRIMANEHRTGRELLAQLAGDLGLEAGAGFEHHGLEILNRMHARHAILGTRTEHAVSEPAKP